MAGGFGSDVVNPKVPENYVKSGEIWAGFYHDCVSTGDELNRQILLRAAESGTTGRTGWS